MKKRGDLSPEKLRIVREMEKKGKLYILPNALARVDEDHRKIVANNNEFRRLVYRQFNDFPLSLLKYISNNEYGQIIVCTDVKAGIYSRAARSAKINPRNVIKETGVFQEEVIHLLDHLLGGQPERSDIYLSAGYGINEKIRKLGKEINALFKRGIYFSKYMGTNEREYLAQGLREFLQGNEDAIEQLDVKLYNMITRKFLNEDYWRNAL